VRHARAATQKTGHKPLKQPKSSRRVRSRGRS
jgi:hypothetical protein